MINRQKYSLWVDIHFDNYDGIGMVKGILFLLWNTFGVWKSEIYQQTILHLDLVLHFLCVEGIIWGNVFDVLNHDFVAQINVKNL